MRLCDVQVGQGVAVWDRGRQSAAWPLGGYRARDVSGATCVWPEIYSFILKILIPPFLC